MPNWAFGYVNVTGTRDGIKSFIERFVSEDDPSTIPGKRFFARSFIQSKRQAFIDEAMKEGLISKTDFCDIRGQYDARIADALIAQEQIDRELSIYLSGEQSSNNWMKTFTEHRGLKSLTRAVVLECIEKVVIHKDEKLEIIFEHSEDYARLVSSLQEYAERGILEEAM